MSNIAFRPVQKSDYKDLMGLIANAWDIPKYLSTEKKQKKLLKLFMLVTLANQNYNQVAVMNGEVVGLLYGKIKKLGKCYKNIKYIPQLLYHSIVFYLGKEERKVAKGFINLQKVYAKLLKQTGKKYDSVLEFFIVHSKTQGKGVGKTLLNNYLEYCKNNDAKSMYVYTDNSCNYGFYDYNGFSRVGSMPAEYDLHGGLYRLNVFLYTRTV